MKYEFEIKEITKGYATEFIQSLHYSKTMPRLTKHFLGCYLENELVGVLTLGWGTQPKATIAKLFEGLDTKDYYEIGKMCMKEEMPKNSESQMISAVVKWMKVNTPERQFLYTWSDGIMGKPGYVYQAANFLYGGFIWTQIYISEKNEKIEFQQWQQDRRDDDTKGEGLLKGLRYACCDTTNGEQCADMLPNETFDLIVDKGKKKVVVFETLLSFVHV